MKVRDFFPPLSLSNVEARFCVEQSSSDQTVKPNANNECPLALDGGKDGVFSHFDKKKLKGRGSKFCKATVIVKDYQQQNSSSFSPPLH